MYRGNHKLRKKFNCVSLNMGLVNFRCANHFISISLLNKKFKYLLWYLNCAVLIRRFIGEHLILARYRIAFWNVTVVGLTISLWVIQHRSIEISFESCKLAQGETMSTASTFVATDCLSNWMESYNWGLNSLFLN